MAEKIIIPGNTFVARSQERVLFADTDAMGIVYNGAYFRFFERARDEYLRQRGTPYSAVEKMGLITPVTDAHAHYYSPFCYDDVIIMDCWVSSLRKASFRFDYRLYLAEKPEEIKVSGHTTMAILDKETRRVCKIPEWLLEVLS